MKTAKHLLAANDNNGVNCLRDAKPTSRVVDELFDRMDAEVRMRKAAANRKGAPGKRRSSRSRNRPLLGRFLCRLNPNCNHWAYARLQDRSSDKLRIALP